LQIEDGVFPFSIFIACLRTRAKTYLPYKVQETRTQG
jgi:hypothetical protein